MTTFEILGALFLAIITVGWIGNHIIEQWRGPEWRRCDHDALHEEILDVLRRIHDVLENLTEIHDTLGEGNEDRMEVRNAVQEIAAYLEMRVK